jgi:hypothetical protein
MIIRGWARQFDDPIDLPRGRQLVTLEAAFNRVVGAAAGCSVNLPKTRAQKPQQ